MKPGAWIRDWWIVGSWNVRWFLGGTSEEFEQRCSDMTDLLMPGSIPAARRFARLVAQMMRQWGVALAPLQEATQQAVYTMREFQDRMAEANAVMLTPRGGGETEALRTWKVDGNERCWDGWPNPPGRRIDR